MACRKQTPAHNLQSHCGTGLLPRPGMQASFTRCISLELGCQECGAPQEHVTSGRQDKTCVRVVCRFVSQKYFHLPLCAVPISDCPCHPGKIRRICIGQNIVFVVTIHYKRATAQRPPTKYFTPAVNSDNWTVPILDAPFFELDEAAEPVACV